MEWRVVMDQAILRTVKIHKTIVGRSMSQEPGRYAMRNDWNLQKPLSSDRCDVRYDSHAQARAACDAREDCGGS